jgi:hypothetical protein
MDHKKSDPSQDLGDYNVPGDRTGETTTARLDASGGVLL